VGAAEWGREHELVEQRQQAVMELHPPLLIMMQCFDSRAQCVSVRIHVLGIMEFLEGQRWRIRFLPCFVMLQGRIQQARMLVREVQETKAVVEGPFFHRIALQLSP